MGGLFNSTSDERSLHVAIIGCGKMGEAILKGWLASDSVNITLDSVDIVVPDDEKRKRKASQYGVNALPCTLDLSPESAYDIVVLAVKPQVMPEVLGEVASLYNTGALSDETLFVSIAAGLTTEMFEMALGGGKTLEDVHDDGHESIVPHNNASAVQDERKVRVVRVMPNMPLQVGMGASVVSGGANATPDDVELTRSLFAALGSCYIVDESQIDAVCAISGGGPAYFAYMVEALGRAGCELGLDEDMAVDLALQTMGGTYHAIVESGATPEKMRASVCSPGGTTLAALSSLDEDGFIESIGRAMKAAVDRARELRS